MARGVAALAIALLLAGCGSGSGNGNGDAQQSEPTSTAGCEPPAGAEINARTATAPTDTMFLTSVRVDARECTDRITFGFRQDGAQPGYNISYEPASAAKIEDGSGNRIEVAGSAFLVVKIQSAATAETVGEQLTFTYTGPRRIEPSGTRFVREVVKSGDFEAVVTWVIGLDEQRPYTATASDSQVVVELG